MKWKFYFLVTSFTLLILANQFQSEDDRSLSDLLLNQALDILKVIPQFENQKTINEEDQVVIELPMDYDFEVQKIIHDLQLARLTSDQIRAKELLEESSRLGNVEANFILGDINLYGNYSYPTNGSLALKHYKKVTELSSNATAFFNVAFIYSTGLFGQTEINQAKANLYYNLAFQEGDLRAAMVLGYRYSQGISLPEDCNKSLYYYQYAANRLKDIYDSGPIGGLTLDSFSIRIADFNGGVYGKGVGDIPNSLQRKASRYDELLVPNSLGSEEPLFNSIYIKVLNFYEGSYLKPRDFKSAHRYAKYAMQQGMQQLSTLIDLDKKYVAKCIYIIGRMFLRGEGVTQDFAQALVHLKKSIDIYPFDDTYNELGMAYEFGPENVRDLEKAEAMYFNSSEGPGIAGKYNYGRLIYSKDQAKAKDLISVAAYHLYLPAVYHKVEFLETSDKTKTCLMAVNNLKYYVEKFDPIITSLEWAFHELIFGRSDNALIGYSMAAEQGYESAQASAGYILYQLPSLLEEPPIIPPERKKMALNYITRSSAQYNVDSTVFLGDLYFSDKDYDKAVAAYEASSMRGSSQGNFNLGWLYENGHGVDKDFHLAKRYYDLSLLSHSKAYLPVQLALLRLRFKSLVNNLTGGKINSIDGENQESRTWSDWKNLYKKIRGQNLEIIENHPDHTDFDDVPQDNDGEMTFDSEDIAVLLFLVLTLGLFFLVQWNQQRIIRNRGVNNQNRANFEFNFRVFAI
ncbi:hypothetical protein WICMUC_001877 [Wickerhamomyces mucosus]|uniref:ERAD-associated E3 ubiquitin-protein ligase component HRD3 n=1 Tax=Wickerhamomyces mucosus TaxID=1378264 RepID=A0A9P8PS51_9ASCO|nr:hypothetical protein WICMUC_001877 [Wickerhamomyces mucosus]